MTLHCTREFPLSSAFARWGAVRPGQTRTGRAADLGTGRMMLKCIDRRETGKVENRN